MSQNCAVGFGTMAEADRFSHRRTSLMLRAIQQQFGFIEYRRVEALGEEKAPSQAGTMSRTDQFSSSMRSPATEASAWSSMT